MLTKTTLCEIIINTAFTGAVSSKDRNLAVPYTPAEILADARCCAALGTSIGHFHVRDNEGKASSDASRYARLFETLRSDQITRDLILCASTSGRHGQTLEQRTAVLELPPEVRPDMASLTLSSMNFKTGASLNSPDVIRFLAETMRQKAIKPELEVFDIGMMEFSHELIEEGLLEPPYYFNIILGNVATAAPNPAHVAAIYASIPQDSVTSIGGVGRSQLRANLMAIAFADGLRVGLEDNLWMDMSRTPATNPLLVERVVRLAELAQRPPKSVENVRQKLRIKDRR